MRERGCGCRCAWLGYCVCVCVCCDVIVRWWCWCVRWQVVYLSRADAGTYYDVTSVSSTDNAVSWSAPVGVSSWGGSDPQRDYYSTVVTDQRGNWCVRFPAVDVRRCC